MLFTIFDTQNCTVFPQISAFDIYFVSKFVCVTLIREWGSKDSSNSTYLKFYFVKSIGKMHFLGNIIQTFKVIRNLFGDRFYTVYEQKTFLYQKQNNKNLSHVFYYSSNWVHCSILRKLYFESTSVWTFSAHLNVNTSG